MPGSVQSPRSTVSRTKPSGQLNGAVKHAPNGASHGPFEIMAARIANRVAEMAENMTFVERSMPSPAPQQNTSQPAKKPPRKLEIRLPGQGTEHIRFSAPFLDNTLGKMLALQNRMLKTGSELAAEESVSDQVKREQFEQSAELARIIALICAEKARQGA
ncbi:hypothetical protein EJ06DRAFT_533466 [Trichodelitschia bisporula]|uniref:Uncharacterized protein n=1 Tax=Trichodelitschia bisporula TaxID=703511 RepID=A0A6G1HMR6_9PEZI|nr:hypothetical protein EJ06DRAFT_533466 [Trichodelitschia bisporula]